jgi:hypothetical protein
MGWKDGEEEISKLIFIAVWREGEEKYWLRGDRQTGVDVVTFSDAELSGALATTDDHASRI